MNLQCSLNTCENTCTKIVENVSCGSVRGGSIIKEEFSCSCCLMFHNKPKNSLLFRLELLARRADRVSSVGAGAEALGSHSLCEELADFSATANTNVV